MVFGNASQVVLICGGMDMLWTTAGTLSVWQAPLAYPQHYHQEGKQQLERWRASDCVRYALDSSREASGRCVSVSGGRHGARKLRLALPNRCGWGRDGRWCMPHGSGNSSGAQTLSELRRSVLNEVGPTSQKAPASEELKDELEALQEEALEVRDRYNSSRARFMRLTEVAEQLRQRAAMDIKLGNEENARKMLKEKQKVIRAAEISKKRAQLLEQLSSKLGEAISRKETQLIIALSRPQLSVSSNAEPTVRVVPPREASMISIDLDLHKQEVVGDTIVMKGYRTDDIPDLEDTNGITTISAETEVRTEAANGVDREVTVDGTGFQFENTEAYSDHAGHFVKDNELDAEEEDKQRLGDSRDMDLQAEESLLFRNSTQGASFTAVLNEGAESCTTIGNTLPHVPDLDTLPHVPDLGSPPYGPDLDDVYSFRKSDSNNGGFPVQIEVSEARLDAYSDKEHLSPGKEEKTVANAEVHFFDGTSLLFEDYLVDVDHQVAAVESKLRIFLATAVNEHQDTGDEKLELVVQLLEEVQSLRRRVSEAVKQLPRQEVQ